MLSWLISLVLVGLLFNVGDKLITALWPPPDWKQEARKWWWSPKGLDFQRARWAQWDAQNRAHWEAKKASLLAAPALRPPAP